MRATLTGRRHPPPRLVVPRLTPGSSWIMSAKTGPTIRFFGQLPTGRPPTQVSEICALVGEVGKADPPTGSMVRPSTVVAFTPVISRVALT